MNKYIKILLFLLFSKVANSAVLTFPVGTTYQFSPGVTSSGLNVGSYAGNPSTLFNGDIWYNSANNLFMFRSNGATETIASQEWAELNFGEGADFTWTGAHNFTAANVTFGTFATSTLNVSSTFQIGGVTVTSSAAELNLLDGVPGTLTTTEIGYVDGVTSAIQTQIDTKAPNTGTLTGTHSSPSTTNPLAPTWTGPAHVIFYGATGEIDLPAAAGYAGRGFICYNTGSFTISFDPNGSEVIVRDGTVQTGGVTMTLSSGAGNYVAMISDGTRWITLGYKGTLAAGS